jgi:hypothetical protein
MVKEQVESPKCQWGLLMEQVNEQKIEELIMCCLEDCKCHKQGIDNLCKAEHVGLEAFVECREKNPFECTTAFSYEDSYCCFCPLRVYIAKELKR